MESLLAQLYARSGYDMSMAERGIVYIDEIDKVLLLLVSICVFLVAAYTSHHSLILLPSLPNRLLANLQALA